MRCFMNYGFPDVTLAPGESQMVKIDIKGVFRAEKLFMAGFMNEIRGHFKLKYSRLPLLNRENVIAYSNVTRVNSKRRTTVEYREGAKGNFVRSYLPSSVEYIHVEPLSYISLKNIFVGNRNQMPTGNDLPAQVFAPESLGNGLLLETSHHGMGLALSLENKWGDIPVKVYATMYGTGMQARREP